MTWREPLNHLNDCFFCVANITELYKSLQVDLSYIAILLLYLFLVLVINKSNNTSSVHRRNVVSISQELSENIDDCNDCDS